MKSVTDQAVPESRPTPSTFPVGMYDPIMESVMLCVMDMWSESKQAPSHIPTATVHEAQEVIGRTPSMPE